MKRLLARGILQSLARTFNERDYQHLPADAASWNGVRNGLCFGEIVLKIITSHAQLNCEVIAMEEINLVRKDVSETYLGSIKETSGSNQTKYDCYKRCMDDPWEMKGESVCASVCGVKES